jgi:serine/threonine protein kinase
VSTFHNGLAMAVVDTIYCVVPDSMAYEVGERDTIINVYRMYAKYGYINKSGKFTIAPRFVSYVNMNEIGDVTNDMDDCSNALYRNSFRNRRAMFYDTTTWKNGYIDTEGNIAIKANYYYSEPFSEGLAVVRDAIAEPIFTNGACITPSRLRCAYIDTLGNNVTDFKYETLTRFSSGRGIGTYKKISKESVEIEDSVYEYETYGEPRYLLNKDGREVKELEFVYKYYGFTKDGICVALHDFLWKIRGDRDYSFFDTNGKRLEPLKGLSKYQLDSLNRCKDIWEALPDNATVANTTYFNDGFAGVSPDNEHWFVIDKFLIIHGYGEESIYDGFRAFNNGLAAVKKKGKWGFINRKIKEQIPCKYDSCGYVYPYLEEVFEYDIQGEVKKKAYINRKDSLVWESPSYKSEKIENRYSIKESKDYGEWTYEYNPLNKHLLYLIIGVLVVLLIAIGVIWKSNYDKSSKGEKNEELVIQKEQENEVGTDTNLNIVNDDDIDEILTYPTVGQYTETIKESAKAPDEYFDKLKHLRPVLDGNGEPIMSSGNFAVVFKMKDEYGKQYAVRCFHRAQRGREKNYKLICNELEKVSSPYISPIRYYDKELFIESGEYPVLLMDWVEGITLDKYIRKVINDKKALIQLAANFRNLAIWLLAQPFAHGDIKPDNILVKNDGSLVLVDYDGMFVPAMQGQKAREIGSPDFRNPSRTEDDFNKDIDNFPIISILLSLELLVENKDYLSQYGAEDRLLFSEEDYRNIEESMLYKRAYSSYKDDLSNLAKCLKNLLNNVEMDNNSLYSAINGDSWRNELYANDKVEKPSRIFYVIYTIALFVFPFVMRSAEWGLLEISLIMLLANVVFLIVLNIVDLCRPSKKYHIHPGGEGGFGCLGMIAVFIPVLLMTDVVSEGMINRSKWFSFLDLPSYNEEWYITLLIWVIWYCSFLVYGLIFDKPYEIRLKYYKTEKEKIIEQEEREKEIVRSEVRKEDERREKEMKEGQKRYSYYDDLPF